MQKEKRKQIECRSYSSPVPTRKQEIQSISRVRCSVAVYQHSFH